MWTSLIKRFNDQNTIAVHVRYNSLYIFLPSSAKQQGVYENHGDNGNENVALQKRFEG